MSILSAVYFKISGNFFDPIATGIFGVGFFSYACADFYDYQSKVKGFFKGLAAYFAAQLLFIALGVIIVILLVMFNPDVYQLIKPSNNH
jgi:hypothetical protein